MEARLKEYCCPSCGKSMVGGHVWVGAEDGASLYWASGETAPKRDIFGRPGTSIVGWDRWRNEQLRNAHLCSVCGIVTIDLEWDKCPNCEQLISRSSTACVCGWKTKFGDRSLDEISREDALADAARLDKLGEWDAAITLYENTAQRWPDQRDYIEACLKGIKEKQALE